jgi:prepilin-type processing-associated H-X9-DG protein
VSESKPKDEPQVLNYVTPYSGEQRRGKGRPIFLWVIIVATFLILLANFLFPTIGRPAYIANRVKSASNLRQIGQAILQYTQDYGGQYPDSFGTILLKEDVTSGLFISPSRSETPAQGPTTQAAADQLADSSHISYIYLGRALTSSTVKPEDVVAYELPAQPNGGANILFGDGHVEFDDGTVLAKIMGRANCGIWPVTMP